MILKLVLYEYKQEYVIKAGMDQSTLGLKQSVLLGLVVSYEL